MYSLESKCITLLKNLIIVPSYEYGTQYLICGTPFSPTLVFDKGNNSSDHIKKLRSGGMKFHVVGSLKLSQFKSLLEISKEQFVPVTGAKYKVLMAYRTTYDVYDQAMTVLVVYNPELEAGQLQGIGKNIEQCTVKLRELHDTLKVREDGTVTKGRRPTLESVQHQVDQILQKEFMKELFDVQVSKTESAITLTFSFQMARLESLRKRQLGKTVLYTDNHDWSDEKIISAYRSQYHIEEAFKQMKNTEHLGFRPIYHWTDQKIKVHAFYCVLALRLCSLLNRELHDHGINLSLNRMLDVLGDIKQVITVYPKKGDSKKDRESFSLSKLSPEARKLMKVLGLDQFRLGR